MSKEADYNHLMNHIQDDDMVCYCFRYTKRNIIDDFTMHGRSNILERINTEKRNNRCKCAEKNPKKR